MHLILRILKFDILRVPLIRISTKRSTHSSKIYLCVARKIKTSECQSICNMWQVYTRPTCASDFLILSPKSAFHTNSGSERGNANFVQQISPKDKSDGTFVNKIWVQKQHYTLKTLKFDIFRVPPIQIPSKSGWTLSFVKQISSCSENLRISCFRPPSVSRSRRNRATPSAQIIDPRELHI
jgi:hypothetical protein